MEKITSRENPAVKEYHRLARSRAYREERGEFVLESVKLVEEALESGVSLRRLFLSQTCLEQHPLLAQSASRAGALCTLISPAVEEKMTLTANSRGCFAVAKRLDKLRLVDTIGEKGRFLYLADLQDTGNVGTILRTAEALGLDGVILSRGCCDLYSLKTLRAAMGSAFRVKTFRSENPAEDLRALGERFATYAAVVHEPGALRAGTDALAQNAVIVIGNEGNGLPPELIACCREKITVPMRGKAESLNASMAAGILMWEMTR